jgi:Ca2+-binding EF-hand superfamily protein
VVSHLFCNQGLVDRFALGVESTRRGTPPIAAGAASVPHALQDGSFHNHFFRSKPMKKIVYSAIAFALLTGTAFAAKEVETKRFNAMDQDNDGKVTATEHAGFWDRWFKRTDKNKDGVLEFEEFNNSSVFARIDKNEDNKIDPDEHKVFFARQFKFLDANKDGHVTLEEYTKEK